MEPRSDFRDSSDSREEIRDKRRERRKLKKENEKLLKEDAARKKLVCQESQKIQVLDKETFEKFKTPRGAQLPVELKNKRKGVLVKPEFSLLSYLAKKKKKKRNERKNYLRVPLVRKGKVKTKKHVTSLKKLIKRFRSLKMEEVSKSHTKNQGKYVHSNTFRR